jgi:hypothetical protein
MEMISVIAWVSLAALPLAVLSGWLAGSGNRPLTALVLGRDGWRRAETAWPHGVQEDDDVTWKFGQGGQEAGGTAPPDAPSAQLGVERVRSTLRVRSR